MTRAKLGALISARGKASRILLGSTGRRIAHVVALSGFAASVACTHGTKGERSPGQAESVASPRRLSQLVVDDLAACVVEDERRVLCWGVHLADESSADDERVARVVDLGQGRAGPRIRELSVGRREVCALFFDGQHRCRRLRGAGTAPTSEAAPDAISVTIGADDQRCVLTQDHTLTCGGPPRTGVIAVAADSGGHRCLLDEDGELFCTQGSWLAGRSFGRIEGATELFSPGFPCARSSDGQMWCARWEHTLPGELEQIPSRFGESIIDIGRQGGYMCALERGGEVWCRGDNDSGQLGAGDSEPHADAVTVSLPGPAREIDIHDRHSCAIVDEGVWCWGEHPTFAREVVVIELEARALHLSRDLSCATTKTGELSCWGERLDPLADVTREALPRVAWTPRSPVDDYFVEVSSTAALLSGDELVYGERLLGRDGRPHEDMEVIWQRRGVASFALTSDALCTLDLAGELECQLSDWVDEELTDKLGRMNRTLTRSGVTSAYADASQICAVARGELHCLPSSPERVRAGAWRTLPGLSGAVTVAGHGPLTCASFADRSVRCWEGHHTQDEYVFETQPTALEVSDIVEFVVASFGVCVRTQAGAIHCGDPRAAEALTAKLDAGAVELDAGDNHWCARVELDGHSETVECHGSNVNGQLGALGAHVMLAPVAITLPQRPIGASADPVGRETPR